MGIIENKKSCFDCKLKHSIFNHLKEEELTLINNSKLQITYNEGEILFKQGAPITHIVSITKGLVKIYIEGLNKKNLILQYIRPGDFLGGPGAFVDNIHHYTIAAVEETSACLIDINVFKTLMQKNVNFAFDYIEDISKKGIYNFSKFISLTQKQMHGRVAEALLYFDNIVYPDNKKGFPLNRKDFAELTALSKDSVSRILNSFEEAKTIEISDNVIKILDKGNLEKISIKG